ncbi:MAG: metallophosphoesterase [Actinobacteria bacterium]|nr:metallophosphoesterase [Actinomycetota bacterium]
MIWVVAGLSLAVLMVLFGLYIFRVEPFNFGLSKVSINIDTGPASGGTQDTGNHAADGAGGEIQEAGIRGTGMGPAGTGSVEMEGQNKVTREAPMHPPKSRLLNILHLSDFHLRKSKKGDRLSHFIHGLKDGDYDFIFITGDLVDNTDNLKYLIDMLAPLNAKYGKYAVLGVHDHYRKALREFAGNMFKRKRSYARPNDMGYLGRKLEDIGIEILENENRTVKIPDGPVREVEIIGLGDPVIEKTDFYKAFRGMEQVIESDIVLWTDSGRKTACRDTFYLKEERIHRIRHNGKLRISLIHTPDSLALATLAGKGVDIVFAGHTHGGQVRLPLIGAVITGCRLKTKFASGLFYFKKMVLYISRGLGEGKFSQFRCLCPPEASIVKIYKI